ncbi:MAG: amidase [Pseudomonadota bacterium]
MRIADQIARAAERDAMFSFLEAPAESLAVDRDQAVSEGRLSGLLVGVKSNISVAGQAWTAGIRGRSSEIADDDAEVVGVLRRAGAVMLGRLTMDEAALGAATETSGFRATQNPEASGRSVGGSSGGAASAVASGALQVALGSDTLGSVRIPASYCGVLGLKPGPGLLPMGGVFPLAEGFDTVGLLARETRVLNDILDLFGAEAETRHASVKSAMPGAQVVCDPGVADALEQAQMLFEQEGRWSGRLQVAGWSAAPVRMAAYSLVCARAVNSLADQPVAGRAVEKALAFGQRLSAEEITAAQTLCDRAAEGLRQAVSDNTVLLTPTTPDPAFPRGTKPPSSQADFTAIANLAGLPALAVPIPSGDLPQSVQLIGPQGSERTLLSLADILLRAGSLSQTQA